MSEKSEKSWLHKATNYFNNRQAEKENEKKRKIFKETKWQMLRIDLQLLESNLSQQYCELGKKVYRETKTKKNAKNKAFLKVIEKSHHDIEDKKKDMKALEMTILASHKKKSEEQDKISKEGKPKEKKPLAKKGKVLAKAKK